MGMLMLGRSQSRLQAWINPMIAWFLAVVFASAAIAKLVNFTDFMRVVRGYELFPPDLIPLLSIILVSLEITIAVTLGLPGLRRIGAYSSALTLIFFLGLVALALGRGLVVDCGCFVFLQSRSLGIGLLIQDALLLALALALILRTRPAQHPKPPNPDSHPTRAPGALAAP